MNRFARTALLASVLVLPLAACSNFDPTDLFDNSFFNTKKPLSGDRKPLFPEGTPGVPQGVPPDLYKGYQSPNAQNGQDALANSQASAKPPDAPEDQPQAKSKPKPKPKVAAAPPPKPPPSSVTVQQAGSSSPWPASPQQSGQTVAPASGNGQSIWPDPPAPGTFGR